jgi:thymidine phosphorylase
MIDVGKEMGVEVSALLNPMSEPTGRAVGNALEVIEALECLDGKGPEDLRSIVLDLSEKIAGLPRAELAAMLDDGTARRKFDAMVARQGGRPADLPRLAEIHKAPVIHEVKAPHSGRVLAMDAGLIGQASLELGAGRAKAKDAVDFAVGFDSLAKCGEEIFQGDLIARIHARSEVAAAKAEEALLAAAVIG